MKDIVNPMFKAALKDRLFNEECEESDPKGFFKPKQNANPIVRNIYVAIYFGWLSSRGEFDRNDY